MTSSSEGTAARLAIARLRTLLDAEQLRETIDVPVDAVVDRYLLNAPAVCTHTGFREALTQLVQQVHEQGLRRSQCLSASEALGEALELIQAGYLGRAQDRYDAAYADATATGSDGLNHVLLWLGQTIKHRERQKYISQAVLGVIDPTDWPTKCALVEALREQYPHLFPPEIAALPTAELANEFLQLLSTVCGLADHERAHLDWFGL